MGLSDYAKDVNWRNAFFHNYGAEAIALIEITMPKSRVVYFDEEANEKLMNVELNLLDEQYIEAQLCHDLPYVGP